MDGKICREYCSILSCLLLQIHWHYIVSEVIVPFKSLFYFFYNKIQAQIIFSFIFVQLVFCRECRNPYHDGECAVNMQQRAQAEAQVKRVWFDFYHTSNAHLFSRESDHLTVCQNFKTALFTTSFWYELLFWYSIIRTF